MTRRAQARSYLIELHIRGILHLQIERLPHWLTAAIPAAVGGWVLTRR